jgi:hypothetical protein
MFGRATATHCLTILAPPGWKRGAETDTHLWMEAVYAVHWELVKILLGTDEILLLSSLECVVCLVSPAVPPHLQAGSRKDGRINL